jgi:hypothetical protein
LIHSPELTTGIAGIESREQQGTPNGHKQAKGTLVPQHFDPHVMAIDTDEEIGTRRSIHILLDQQGLIEGRREDRRTVSTFSRPTRHGNG